MKTRYALPLLAFTFVFVASFLVVARSSLLHQLSSTMPHSINTHHLFSLFLRQPKPLSLDNAVAPRKLCGYTREAKKAALQKLEDVLLEPPRAASGKSSRYMKRTKYLPDLMGDSLESYPRRVFIDVGLPEKKGTDWFAKNYPTRGNTFEIYNIETVAVEMEIGMSDWVRKNVKEEEFVVMKAEAEVVEEMVKTDSIGLVDELFLECKPKRNGDTSRRAYWECLALYGKLRDEGVAVHQWWG
ncbi:uncharacterized protein LOC109797940 [Cajanus cajan]|uniref:DUF7870 domain-containing protein n=1 Tax=Cajanus cajan TaxID=3821 RepID=A0A151TSU1_CAJCA|nr:uncharacterized protein LOC109797940 [Cajanus cajan]KYP70087.1 hypothetical protein KK1_009295 [Cajanus cajan]